MRMADVTYPCYWEKKENSGHWYWIYYASNGQAIARSSESYVKRSENALGADEAKRQRWGESE